jgi:Flp pilus assembly protein TadG
MISICGGNERGSVTVEFALVLPFIMLAMLAVLQAGVTGAAHIMVSQAAREGARQATTADSDAEITQAAIAAAGIIPADRLRVSWSTGNGWQTGLPVTVVASAEVPCIFPALAKVWPTAYLARATSTMRLEKDR